MLKNIGKYCTDRAEVCLQAHLRFVNIPCPMLISIGKYCANRAEVCRKAHLHLVNSPCPMLISIGKYCADCVEVNAFKSNLDLHLSESDWCGLVVRFWLRYLN